MNYSQIRTGLLTLTIGNAVVPFVNGLYAKWSELPVNLPQASSDVLYIIAPDEETRFEKWFREGNFGAGSN